MIQLELVQTIFTLHSCKPLDSAGSLCGVPRDVGFFQSCLQVVLNLERNILDSLRDQPGGLKMAKVDRIKPACPWKKVTDSFRKT